MHAGEQMEAPLEDGISEVWSEIDSNPVYRELCSKK
jgi:hypothetical protein